MSDLTGPSVTFTVGTIRRAVDLYLAIAYEGVPIPDVVTERLVWPEVPDIASLLDGPPFERAGRPEPGIDAIHALRLGNARYPHMKLQIQPWPSTDGFLLSVNTHDQILSMSAGMRGSEAFRELQAENQRIKEAIEEAWERNGLPTFLNYLRTYITSQDAGQESDPDQPGGA